MLEKIINEIISIASPLIAGIITITIVNTAVRIAMNYCRCNWTIENEKDDEEIKINEERKTEIDEDLKKYFNYEEK